MGFSVSASTAIIFAGLFLVVGILYPAVSNGYERVTDAEIDRDDAQLDMRNTDINITNITGEEIKVKNEGSTSLDASTVDLVVDGDYQERDTYTRDPADLWLPGETLSLGGFDTATDQIRVVTDNGVSATGEVP